MAGILAVGRGQTDKKKYMTPNELSPPRQTSVTINGKEVWISYHAPSVRVRKIFGGAGALQPDNSTCRLGADWATFLHTDVDLDLNGVAVPPGEYTLFVALDEGKWQLVVNKQTGQWGVKLDGSANLDPAKDAGRIPMTMSKPSAPVEQLKITLSYEGKKGKLQVEWENVVASVPFTLG